MVRINFCTYIKTSYVLTVLCLFSPLTIYAKPNEQRKTRTHEVKQENVSDTAYAWLEDIVLESSGIIEKLENKPYECKAYIKKLTTSSDQEMACDEMNMVCTIDKHIITGWLENVFMSPYSYFGTDYYLVDGINASLQIEDMIISANSAIADTRTQEIMLYDCSGSYNNRANKNAMLSNLVFKTRSPVKLKDLTLWANDITIENKQFQATLAQINLSIQKTGTIQKAVFNTQNFVVNARKVEIHQLSQTAAENAFTAYDVIAKCIKQDETIIIKTTTVHYKDEKLVFVDPILIETKQVALRAMNGQQIGDKIILSKINFRTKNACGFSERGYFDIKNRKLILESGNIEWQS